MSLLTTQAVKQTMPDHGNLKKLYSSKGHRKLIYIKKKKKEFLIQEFKYGMVDKEIIYAMSDCSV